MNANKPLLSFSMAMLFVSSFNVGASDQYLVADVSSNAIRSLQDKNGDGDALDVGESTLWANGFGDISNLVARDGIVYATDFTALPRYLQEEEIVALQDLNGDGDALDAGERRSWARGGAIEPRGIDIDDNGFIYVASHLHSNVLRFFDLNNDGDANDPGEQVVYASGISYALGIDTYGSDVYVTASGSDVLRRLRDDNGDGDALDDGENQIIATGFEGPTAVRVLSNTELLVVSTVNQTIYRGLDLNDDGDFLDNGELLLYADAGLGFFNWPFDFTESSDGRLLVTNSFGVDVIALSDNNKDGDALDNGEQTLFANGFANPAGIISYSVAMGPSEIQPIQVPVPFTILIMGLVAIAGYGCYRTR